MKQKLKVYRNGKAVDSFEIRSNDFMLGIRQKIEAKTGIAVKNQLLSLRPEEEKDGVIPIVVKEKPRLYGWVKSNDIGLIFACVGCFVAAAMNGYCDGFVCGVMCIALAIWFIVQFTNPREDVIDNLKVSDAIFKTFSTTQVRGLTRARFNESKLKKMRVGYFDTIVIGSGVGGCTASAVHAQSGKKVLLLEQNERFGGCTHSFEMGSKKNGTACEFDTGLHYVSADMAYPSCRSGALQKYITRGQVEFTDLGSPYDIVTFRDAEYPINLNCPASLDFNFYTGVDALIENILKHTNPGRKAKKVLKPRLKVWFDIVKDAAHTMPFAWLIRLFPAWLERLLSNATPYRKMLTYGQMTTKDVQWAVLGLGWSKDRVLTEKIPTAPEWKQVEEEKGAQLGEAAADLWPTICRICAVVTHPIGDYACQPRFSSMMAHSLTANYYMEGAAYTVDHTQGISTALLRSVLGTGGQAFCKAQVEEIIVSSQGNARGVRVRNKDQPGSTCIEVMADTVICATSLYNLYNKFLRSHPVSDRFKNEFQGVPSFGHTYLFVTLAADVPTTAVNTWYFGDFDLDKSFDDYFNDPVNNGPPTCYIGFPSMKDINWQKKYPNCKSALMIADAKWEWFAKWVNTEPGKRGKSYEKFKKQLAHQLLEVLYSKVPGTRGKTLEYWLGTPLSDQYYLGSFQGGSYGTRCNQAYFDPGNLKYLMRSSTPLNGLHMAGSDAFCPSVAGAQYGGLLGGLNSVSFFDRLRFARELLSEQANAICEIEKCSFLGGVQKAILSNIDWIDKIRPSPRKLRKVPPFCTDDVNDKELFCQLKK